MVSSKKDNYSHAYQTGLLAGYAGYLGNKAYGNGLLVLWTLLIGFIYFVIYYCSKHYLSKKEFQIPRWIDIIIALVLPLSMFVSNKIILVGLLLLPFPLRFGGETFQDNWNWMDFIVLPASIFYMAFILAGDYANITMLLESERLHIIVPMLITYYLFVIIFFYYLRQKMKVASNE